MHPSYKPSHGRKRLKSFYAENISQASSTDGTGKRQSKNKTGMNTKANRRGSLEIDSSKNYFGIGFKLNLDELETCISQHEGFSQIG